MYFQNYDFRVQYFDDMIDKIRDTGVIDYFFNKWQSPKNMKDRVELADEPLVIEHFLLSTIIWSVGLGLSLVLFSREINCGRICNVLVGQMYCCM